MISDRTANVLIYTVTAIWVMNVLGGMFKVNGYQSSEAINGIFTLIVGGAFALRSYILKREKADKDA